MLPTLSVIDLPSHSQSSAAYCTGDANNNKLQLIVHDRRRVCTRSRILMHCLYSPPFQSDKSARCQTPAKGRVGDRMGVDCRSEEPVPSTNMDISTGHIILVSRFRPPSFLP